MIVTCPNCATKYNLPDDKIPAGGAKVKCSKCAHVFKAELPPASPEEEVETLLEQEPDTPADTDASDEFDETFDEVASDSDTPAEESSPEDPDEDLFSDDGVDAATDSDMPGMDDLFSDSDDASAPEETASADEDDAESATADDVESLFGDDEDLFGDDDADADTGDDSDEASSDDLGDLFDDAGDDEDDTGDLFEDDDDDEEDDDEYEDDDDEYEVDDEPRSRKPLGCLITILVLALMVGGAAYFKVWTMFGLDLGTYFQNVPYIGKMFTEEVSVDEPAAPGESPADRVRKVELKNVKQYYVANEKTGNLFVVEGKAVNKFATPKEQIKVEVVLYDAEQNVLTSKTFLCGNVLSQFQLQVQTQSEIDEGLSSEVGILSNNTFIRPGASTPFMAVFFNPPAGVKEFLVKVVDVGDPE